VYRNAYPRIAKFPTSRLTRKNKALPKDGPIRAGTLSPLPRDDRVSSSARMHIAASGATFTFTMASAKVRNPPSADVPRWISSVRFAPLEWDIVVKDPSDAPMLDLLHRHTWISTGDDPPRVVHQLLRPEAEHNLALYFHEIPYHPVRVPIKMRP
jgi:hypothetical protein